MQQVEKCQQQDKIQKWKIEENMSTYLCNLKIALSFADIFKIRLKFLVAITKILNIAVDRTFQKCSKSGRYIRGVHITEFDCILEINFLGIFFPPLLNINIITRYLINAN